MRHLAARNARFAAPGSRLAGFATGGSSGTPILHIVDNVKTGAGRTLESSRIDNRRFVYAGIVLLLAAALSVAAAGQVVLVVMGDPGTNGYPGGFPHALIMHTPRFFLWLPFLPLIKRVSRAVPVDLSRPARWLPAQIGIAVGIVIAHFSIRSWFMAIIGHGYGGHGLAAFIDHFSKAVISGMPLTLVEYLIIFGVFVGLDWARRHREREILTSQLAAQLSEARLHALRMQLNPHFLFNTMNSIATLVRTGSNAEAVSMISGLSELMRYVLANDPPVEVSLAEEVAFLEKYLAIEKMRFGSRINVVIDVPAELLGAQVPSLILQPLVENAIRHGLSSRSEGGEIHITARRQAEQLELEVRDNGVGLSGSPFGGGVGLTNTRDRLATLYGSQQWFTVENAEAGGVIVRIELPFHTTALTTAQV